MKVNTLQNLINFIFKYIWLFFSILIVLELGYTAYNANILMQQSTKGMLQSVCDEVSGRVDGVLRLLDGLSKDERISDISVPLFDRAILMQPYQDSYGLYMLALCDEDVNVISADETAPPAKPYSLSYRDYMQELYTTGEPQITDAFVAGADNTTVNYTIAVPIKENDEVKGCVFGSIYFDDIQNIIQRNIDDKNQNFYLIGSNNDIMAGNNQKLIGKSYLEATKDVHFLTSSPEEVNENMLNNKSESYWELEAGSIWYVSYQSIAPADWVIAYRVRFTSILEMLFPGLLVKILLYGLMCAFIYILGPKYLRTHLADVNHLLDRMASMQRELFQTEPGSIDNLLDLTQGGLTDHLTGLSTRTVFLQKSIHTIQENESGGALMFIDLDDLKLINDNFGHEAGDCALIHFANVLKKFEQTYKGVAARYGGDEFVMILNNTSEHNISDIAASLCAQLSTTITIKGKNIPIHGSIGISFYPAHGKTLEDLICKADLALYSAKRSGKNQYSCYNEKNLL